MPVAVRHQTPSLFGAYPGGTVEQVMSKVVFPLSTRTT